MEKMCIDSAFGEMQYKYRWYKTEAINIFSKEWNITVAARAYSGKSICDKQRECYILFKQNESKFMNSVAEIIKNYINENVRELSLYWSGARRIINLYELAQVVEPKTLIFNKDGTVILLFDCVWDKEHGIGVQIMPEVKVGSQDLFL